MNNEAKLKTITAATEFTRSVVETAREYQEDANRLFDETIWALYSAKVKDNVDLNAWKLGEDKGTKKERAADVLVNELWISTEEQLPEDSEVVLVNACGLVGNMHMVNSTEFGYLENGQWYLDDYYGEDIRLDKVTHWMPVPVAPEE